MRAVRAITSLAAVPHSEEEDHKMLRELVGEDADRDDGDRAQRSGTEPGLGTSQQEPLSSKDPGPGPHPAPRTAFCPQVPS